MLVVVAVLLVMEMVKLTVVMMVIVVIVIELPTTYMTAHKPPSHDNTRPQTPS